jgi:hypothetical protein
MILELLGSTAIRLNDEPMRRKTQVVSVAQLAG